MKQNRLNATWIGLEAARMALNQTGIYFTFTVFDIATRSRARVESKLFAATNPGGRPAEILWPYGLDVPVEAARTLIHELLIRELPEYWESSTEDYLISGIMAQRAQRESASLDLYSRVHL